MTRSWEIYLGYEKSILNFVQEVFILITIQIFSQGIIFFSSSLHKFLSHRINYNKIAKKLNSCSSKDPKIQAILRGRGGNTFSHFDARKFVNVDWQIVGRHFLSLPSHPSLSLSLPLLPIA